MSREIKIFLTGIANSLNVNGYYNIVTSPKKLGETTKKIQATRKKNHARINKVVDGKLAEYTA